MTRTELEWWAEDFAAFHARFAPFFGRSEPRATAERYVRGLLESLSSGGQIERKCPGIVRRSATGQATLHVFSFRNAAFFSQSIGQCPLVLRQGNPSCGLLERFDAFRDFTLRHQDPAPKEERGWIIFRELKRDSG